MSDGKLSAKLNRPRRVNLRTVATSLGLPVTTVSRALKDGPEVNSETIDLVKKAAAKLGYRPNLGGLNLRTGKTHAVGVVMPFHRNAEMNIVVASLIEGCATRCGSAGIEPRWHRSFQTTTGCPLSAISSKKGPSTASF
jgi:DNA-binding LacI/PurR family transcriptional regulator